jgi:hypothetical protein
MRSPNAEKPATATVNGLQEVDLAGQLDNSLANNSSPKTQATSKWRTTYKVHPAADIWPMMSDAELAVLGEDIKANGLREYVTVSGDRTLLDGRNRLEAMERSGVVLLGGWWQETVYDDDPLLYILSKNLYRRHLSKQERADAIVAAAKLEVENKPGHVGPVPSPRADVASGTRSRRGPSRSMTRCPKSSR